MNEFEILCHQLIPQEAITFIPLIWGSTIRPIKDIIFPCEVTQLRPGTGKTGVKMIPQYVVIHDTGMTNPEDNAAGLSRYIHAQATSPTGRVASWHFSIDDHECYNHIPTDEQAWHAGDGKNAYLTTYFNQGYQKECIGGGNQNGIGIESCINPGNDYPLTVLRLARLTAQLLKQYNLGFDRIKQHHDFSGKNCPNVIRATSGMWEFFLNAVRLERSLLDLDENATVQWEISHSDIIHRNGTITRPLKDTIVECKLEVNRNITQTFSVLVKAIPIRNQIQMTKNTIIASIVPQVIVGSLTLPTIDVKTGVKITWNSDQEAIFSSTGIYTPPKVPTLVHLSIQLELENEQEHFILETEVQS